MSNPSVNLSTLPIPSKKDGPSQSFEAILNKYADSMGLSKSDLDKLTNVSKNGEYLLSSNNPGFVYEIFGMIKVLGFEQTMNFLESLDIKGKVRPVAKNILDSILFEREETLYQNDIAIIRDEFQVKVKGLYKCPKCGGQDTVDQTSSRQRSSDEATIFEITCQSCSHRWKRG